MSVDEIRPAGIADIDQAVASAACYRSFAAEIGVWTDAGSIVATAATSSRVPDARLREALQGDPAMAALLPSAAGWIAPGGIEHAPFHVTSSGLVLLPPTLLRNSAALAVVARWGLEALHVLEVSAVDERWLTAILRHGAGLIAAAPLPARDLLIDMLPEDIARELCADRGRHPSLSLLGWLAGRIEGAAVPNAGLRPDEAPANALVSPIEQLLVSGGDSRLALDPLTGLNRYDVPPRPRPKTVQLCSSTASPISEHGFMYCDALRRDLFASVLSGRTDEADLRFRAVDATGGAICAMLGLAPDRADVAIAPSGTDAELLTVMLSLAGAGGRPVTNILISPEESGRGVRFAAAGRYFDDVAATGAPVRKDTAAWPDAGIDVREIEIRDADGLPRASADLDAAFLAAGREALNAGNHVLAHVLACSKTGLSGPSLEVVESLVGLAPDRVDVAVDACQMRSEPGELGKAVERGWMVQVSGSKFLGGPAFSGALVLPQHLRTRAGLAARLLAAAPGVGRAGDWSAWWRERLLRHADPGAPSLGPIFRWLPAILEADLLAPIPMALRRWALGRFHRAIADRLARSLWLHPIDPGAGVAPEMTWSEALSRLSIISFQVFGEEPDGRVSPLDEPSCRAILDLLNTDASPELDSLSTTEEVVAAKQVQIGQPVTLTTARDPVTVLRIVVGARFFTTVGHAGPEAIETALEARIADALLAIDKLELVASRWPHLRQVESRAA